MFSKTKTILKIMHPNQNTFLFWYNSLNNSQIKCSVNNMESVMISGDFGVKSCVEFPDSCWKSRSNCLSVLCYSYQSQFTNILLKSSFFWRESLRSISQFCVLNFASTLQIGYKSCQHGRLNCSNDNCAFIRCVNRVLPALLLFFCSAWPMKLVELPVAQ